jgi:hypothetical protein
MEPTLIQAAKSGFDPPKHVEVSDDLTIVRCVEVEGRPARHIPDCNLTQWYGAGF